MMYPYMTLADETEILHSHLMEQDGVQTIEVHFERSTETGFDVARCQLPSYQWIKKEGFTDTEIARFEDFLHCNAHLLYKYAGNGGIKIA
ncbi:MAG: hypothetical protein RR139_12580 [Lachnospiraceae bacterium]